MTELGKQRFPDLSENDVMEKRKFVKLHSTKKSTLKANRDSARVFKEFLRQNNQDTNFEEYSASKLDEALSQFYLSARKEDGNFYKITTLNFFRFSINRYLRGPPFNKDFDLRNKSTFEKSNLNLRAAIAELRAVGGERTPTQAITAEDLNRLYTSQYMKSSSPKGLFNKVQFELRIYLCRYAYGSHDFHEMKRDTFEIIQDDETGLRYVQKREKCPSNSKESSCKMKEMPGSLYCPVASYELYMSKLPEDSVFLWHKPRQQFIPEETAWFAHTRAGKKFLSTFMSSLSKLCGLSTSYNNRSIRFTETELLRSTVNALDSARMVVISRPISVDHHQVEQCNPQIVSSAPHITMTTQPGYNQQRLLTSSIQIDPEWKRQMATVDFSPHLNNPGCMVLVPVKKVSEDQQKSLEKFANMPYYRPIACKPNHGSNIASDEALHKPTPSQTIIKCEEEEEHCTSSVMNITIDNEITSTVPPIVKQLNSDSVLSGIDHHLDQPSEKQRNDDSINMPLLMEVMEEPVGDDTQEEEQNNVKVSSTLNETESESNHSKTTELLQKKDEEIKLYKKEHECLLQQMMILRQSLSSCKDRVCLLENMLAYDNLRCNTYLFKFYTGYTPNMFDILFSFVVKSSGEKSLNRLITMNKKLSLKTQLLLTLNKLRNNFSFIHLGHLHSITASAARSIFLQWLSLMAEKFEDVFVWPHRDSLKSKMLPQYETDFPNTIAIIKLIQIKAGNCSSQSVENKANLKIQTQCNHAVIAVDPRGAVIWCSKLFSNASSQGELLQVSGLKTKLQELLNFNWIYVGDGILADETLNISEELERIGLKVNDVSFSKNDIDEDLKTILKQERVKTHQVVVNRVHTRMKKFKILSQKIPSSLCSSSNNILNVCAFLTNFQPPWL